MKGRTVFPWVVLIVLVIAVNAAADDYFVTKDGYYASISEQALQKFIEYLSHDDREACNQLVKSKLVFQMKSGMKVYIVESRGIFGFIKIRPKGQTIEVWTVRSAIR